MQDLQCLIYDYSLAAGLSESYSKALNMLALLVGLLIIIVIADFIARKLLINVFNSLAAKSKTNFDDLLVNHKAPRNIAHIVPLIITLKLFPFVFYDYPEFESHIIVLIKVYGIILTVWIIRSVLKTFESYFKTLPRLRDKPIDSYIQVGMLFIWIIGFASILAVVINLSFLKFFTTLGAASAILLLIFKDTIMGFVASIQVAINDSVRIGDWITMEKYGADGDVIEINLSTVQVQNFDLTITHIPTFALITDSFKNWRGMQSSGGRRIKRSVLLKAKSIQYLTDDKIEKLKDIQLITAYLNQRQNDIVNFNTSNAIDKSTLINGRNLTNLGVFRKYMQSYIENHSGINKDMMIMVRQLAPTPQGLPLEIYAFSADKRWANYEYIMSDIFDHALAAVPYFDLEVFELSTVIDPSND
ncbi:MULTISPECIES: mechanosensitive ion channel family protein [Bizionia]|uniref:Mechanosensitive ion channel family protein n=1 Tax=Bizionia algoritergicola TaxID=291187 RepID=A0A5D0QWI6_9FLAO|nr:MULTISPECIES: mechanosensitive ion channel domain-containing protein [Bizionia]OBX24040.1 mechanosensitive ion channel protein MscS [Bizionia sp. APA-3]TYB73550.1 mechanosensitive ion channel family protein [Bizionia algoritergicola]